MKFHFELTDEKPGRNQKIAREKNEMRTVFFDASEQVMRMCIAGVEHGTEPSATCKLTSRPPCLDEHRNMRFSSPPCVSRCQAGAEGFGLGVSVLGTCPRVDEYVSQ